MRNHIAVLLMLSLPATLCAQEVKRFQFNGQLSVFGNYAPDNTLNFLFGGRYLPELSYTIPLQSDKKIDFFASANIYGNIPFRAFDSIRVSGDITPYRLWMRYLGKQIEVRLGLQKIDFGSATVLRPLQWFNRVNPRDPLGVADGVYAALVRYYFLNNANIWFWVLYGNDQLKGFEIINTNQKIPEVGARVQYPIPHGELGLTYHYRTADSRNEFQILSYEEIPEHRYGLDAKWDLEVGFWLELSHIQKLKALSILSNQTLINVGVDYTFGIGSGLHVAAEHLLGTTNEKAFQFENNTNTSAITLTYPISFFDNINALVTYTWEEEVASFFLNYEHQFKKFAGYVMFFYTPATKTGLIENEMQYSLSGPGIRLMLVYNH